ncbi:MAG: DegT/DnrJ/EryC1/StrS family aminotransferase [Desulfatiglandales bacterium]
MPGYEVIGEEEKREVLDVLDRGILFRYEFHDQRKGIYKVEEFERAFRRYVGSRYSLALSSGTAALKVGLASMGVGPGDEVITQGFTFVATWEAILDIGATPVFGEIDDTLCLSPEDLPKRITKNTKAIIPVHMCGAQARVDQIVEIARKEGIYVLEDTAQACGGRLKGKYLGTFGDMGEFSFDSVKTLTTGEGGMLVTDREELYIRASEYHDHGHDHNPKLPRGLEGRNFIGFNFRMMELQGALGLAQLGKLGYIIKCQRENKKRLKEEIGKIPGVTFRNILDEEGDIGSFLVFFMPSPKDALNIKAQLDAQKIPNIYWYKNLWHYYGEWEHLLEGKSVINSGYPFKNPDGSTRLIYKKDALPRTEDYISRSITIPINIRMEGQLEGILEGLKRIRAEWSF